MPKILRTDLLCVSLVCRRLHSSYLWSIQFHLMVAEKCRTARVCPLWPASRFFGPAP